MKNCETESMMNSKLSEIKNVKCKKERFKFLFKMLNAFSKVLIL